MDKFPKFARSQSALAKLICERFKFGCSQANVHHWLNGNDTHGATSFLPPQDARNQFNVQDCFDWVEKWILPHRNGNNAPKPWEKTTKERMEEKKDMLLAFEVQSKSELYIERSVAERTATVAIKRLLSFYKQTDEQRTPAALEQQLHVLQVTPEQSKAILDWLVAWHQKITDEREAAMERALLEVQADG